MNTKAIRVADLPGAEEARRPRPDIRALTQSRSTARESDAQLRSTKPRAETRYQAHQAKIEAQRILLRDRPDRLAQLEKLAQALHPSPWEDRLEPTSEQSQHLTKEGK